MSRDVLHLCMTMDVERVAEFSPTGGPPDWDAAERSVRGYCEVLAERGTRATLFIVPDTATQQGEMLRDVASSTGTELGLHIHPQCWRDHYQRASEYDYLGGYTGHEQRTMLAEAREQAEEGLGVKPVSFRGGNFSANDETFRVLAELGFTHGSVSQPGRVATRFRAVWADANWDVHRAHGAFRGAAGDLDFVEVPLTSDRAVTTHWTGIGDVRLEGATAEQIEKAARQEVTRQIEEGALMKHVCILTHNFVNYTSADASEKGRRGVLVEALDRLGRLADELGLDLKGVTTAEVREEYLKRESEAERMAT